MQFKHWLCAAMFVRRDVINVCDKIFPKMEMPQHNATADDDDDVDEDGSAQQWTLSACLHNCCCMWDCVYERKKIIYVKMEAFNFSTK